jgi:hypothetical protein
MFYPREKEKKIWEQGWCFKQSNSEFSQRTRKNSKSVFNKGVNPSSTGGGGDGLQIRKVRWYATRICFLILVHWNGISSVLEALVKL